MDLNDSPQQGQFRAEVREWLTEHRREAPSRTPTGDEQEYIEARRRWQAVLVEAGLAGVSWPEEFSGRGLGPIEQVTVQQELLRAAVPGVLDIVGVEIVGPTLIACGTDEQKARYLGPLLHGDEMWCQLFSEPAAGSDLAGIRCRADAREGGFVINGQKVWASHSEIASFGTLLARTDFDVPKHQGLTMFVLPMETPGVSIRGLRQISGEATFAEVFLDDVRLGPEHVLGGVGAGWLTALAELMYERLIVGTGTEWTGPRTDRFTDVIAANPNAARDPLVRQRLGHLIEELTALRFLNYRTLSALQRGQVPGPESALSKITAVTAILDGIELVVDILGPDALEDGESEWAYGTSFLPGLKSAGGTEEILRNTVGERVLGLPSEPRVDKGIPFRDLRTAESAGE